MEEEMMNNFLNQFYPYSIDNNYPNNYYQNMMKNTSNLNTSENEVFNGFMKGNYFDSLYDPYKNYQPIEPTISTERESLLEELQAYNFVITDLNLYLDVNPNDTTAINLFNNYTNSYKKLTKMFEEKYGPLTIESGNKTNTWQWIQTPWPWEVQK